MKKRDGFGGLLGRSWDNLFAKFGILVSLGALFSFLPNAIFEIWNSNRVSHIIQGVSPSLTNILMEFKDIYPWLILSWLFYTFLSVSVIYFLNAKTSKGKSNFISSVKGGWDFYGKGLMLSVLIFLFLIPLYLLLIIPGIVFQIYWMFALYVLITDKNSIMQSIKKSHAIVKGRWWKVFGYMLLFSLIVGIASSLIDKVFSYLGYVGIALQIALTTIVSLFSLVFVNNFYSNLRKK